MRCKPQSDIFFGSSTTFSLRFTVEGEGIEPSILGVTVQDRTQRAPPDMIIYLYALQSE